MNTIIPAYQIVNNHFSAPPGKVALLYGERGVYATATLVAAEIVRRGGSVLYVDGANRVDPRYLAKLARYQRIDPLRFLDRAYVSRAYTFYQMDVALTDGLLETIQVLRSTVLIVYGLLDLVDDDQVPVGDVVEILGRIHVVLKELKERRISTLLVSMLPHFQLKEREGLFGLQKEMADTIYRLEEGERHQRILFEGENHGTHDTDRHAIAPAGGIKLVKIPAGAQKRGSRYSR